MRKMLAFAFVLILAFDANAQIKIEGPKEATTGYRVKAKLTLDVTDPKIDCFPSNDDWYAVQDLSGNKYIDFVPGRKSVPAGQKSQLYTFVVAGNKANKTYLELWQVTVTPDGEVIPPPKPVPPDEQTQLYKDMLAAYKVFPSASGLRFHKEKYKEFLEEVKADKYTSASAAGTALAKKFESSSDLKGVREVVTDYLQKHAGNTWNKQKVIDAMTNIVKEISAIPE
jgi:hypothetical protein